MELTSTHTRPNGSSRDGLIAAVLDFLSGQDLLTMPDIRAALEREIDDAGADALLALKRPSRLTTVGTTIHAIRSRSAFTISSPTGF
jgi:hypothetical protein